MPLQVIHYNDADLRKVDTLYINLVKTYIKHHFPDEKPEWVALQEALYRHTRNKARNGREIRARRFITDSEHPDDIIAWGVWASPDLRPWPPTALRTAPPPSELTDYVHVLVQRLRDLREAARQGRRCFHLEVLGTTAAHQRRGAATQIINFGFQEADAQQAICLIDTPADSPAMPLLQRLGFVVEAEDTIELKDGERVVGSYRHVAMTRLPVPAVAPGAPATVKVSVGSAAKRMAGAIEDSSAPKEGNKRAKHVG